MKEIAGVAVNMAIVPGDGKKGFRPAAEVIIVVTEPQYRLAGDDVTRERVAETLRFICTPSGLRTLAADFPKWADEAEAWAAGLGGDKNGD